MKRTFSLLLVLSMTAALVLGGCGKKSASGSTHVVLNEVAHSIFYAPQYVAIEEGYFEEQGIDLELVTGYGADKVMAAVLSGEADIGFMGSEASIYTYNEGAKDYVVNFAQLTQRAGNFLVAREEMPDFKWEDLKGSYVLGGRKGGMPQMVFEYILKENGLDPASDLEINQTGNSTLTCEFVNNLKPIDLVNSFFIKKFLIAFFQVGNLFSTGDLSSSGSYFLIFKISV